MLTNFQNASNLAPVKRPPGFNSVNNGVSRNTSGREYNNRASFSHAPMPVGPGYGSNSISVIPQSVHGGGEEGLMYQQTQQNLYISYGNSFLATSPLVKTIRVLEV